MTYEEALQIAKEELDDKIEYLSDTFEGHSARIESYIYDLSMARKALMQALQKVDEPYDQTALELCERCGWKTLIPDEGCLNCKRREWVGLGDAYECTGCGHLTRHPHKDLMILRKAGHHSCCPEREMELIPKREWVGLTKEELQDLCVKSYHTDNAGETHFNRGYFADAIEAKLKEKNT